MPDSPMRLSLTTAVGSPCLFHTDLAVTTLNHPVKFGLNRSVSYSASIFFLVYVLFIARLGVCRVI